MGLFEFLIVFWILLLILLNTRHRIYLRDLSEENEELYKKIMDVERQIYQKVNWDE